MPTWAIITLIAVPSFSAGYSVFALHLIMRDLFRIEALLEDMRNLIHFGASGPLMLNECEDNSRGGTVQSRGE